jgi:hypothetical protein
LALAVLSAAGKASRPRLEKTVLLGELALDGRVRPVHGVLPAVLAAKREGVPAVVVPFDNLAEASLVEGIEVFGARTLRHLQEWVEGNSDLEGASRPRRIHRTRWPTWPRWSVRPPLVSRWSWPPPARITCCSPARPGSGRPCSRNLRGRLVQVVSNLEVAHGVVVHHQDRQNLSLLPTQRWLDYLQCLAASTADTRRSAGEWVNLGLYFRLGLGERTAIRVLVVRVFQACCSGVSSRAIMRPPH